MPPSYSDLVCEGRLALRFLGFIAITIIISGCGMPQILSALSGKPEAQSRQTELALGQLLMIDGYDPGTGVKELK